MVETYNELAKAFTIFAKYSPQYADVSAEHDVLYAGPDPETVSDEDKKALSELGWEPETEYNCFYYFT